MTGPRSTPPTKPRATAKHGSRKPASRSAGGPRAGAGGTLLGIFIGLALGLALAAAVAWTLMGGRQGAPSRSQEAAVAPRDATACRYCARQALCRVGDAAVIEDDEETGE